MLLTLFISIQVHYVDRIVLQFERFVPRVIPAFIGWISDHLMDREVKELSAAGFGQGRIEPRYVPPLA